MIDWHVHSSPDVFGRAVDDFEVTRKAIEAKMGALVLKNHVMETGARTWLESCPTTRSPSSAASC